MKRPEGFDQPEPLPPQPGRQSRPERVAKPARSPKAQKEQKPPKVAKSPSEPSASQPSSRADRADERTQARAARAQSRRFTRSSRRRRVTWLVAASIVLLLIAVLAVAVFSPILALRTVRVEGTTTIKPSAVRAALDDQVGTPLALLDTARIDRDLSRFTLIRSYVTEIVPPNTLVVRIVERQAIAVVPDGAGFDQVDPAGVVLKTSTTRAGLPVIDIGSGKLGGAAFEAAVKVLLAMPASVASQVQTVSATTLDDVSLTLTGSKHTVLWGSSADSDAKAATLARMLGVKKCRDQPVLNVTAPLVAACGPAGAPSTPTPTDTPTNAP